METDVRVLNAENQLGNCYARLGDSAKALECYLKGERLISEGGLVVDPQLLGKLYLNIGALLLLPSL